MNGLALEQLIEQLPAAQATALRLTVLSPVSRPPPTSWTPAAPGPEDPWHRAQARVAVLMAACRRLWCDTCRRATDSASSAPTTMRTGTLRWLLDLALAFLALGVTEALVKPLAKRFVQRRILASAPLLFR